MTKAVFEVAAFAGSIKKAASVAPSGKGRAFEAAAGIVIEVRPSVGSVIIRATDLDVFYLEWIGSESLDGEDVMWRLPSSVLNTWISKLPIGSGKTVTFEDGGGMVKVSSGRAKWLAPLIPVSSYPTWESFAIEDLTEIESFGNKLSMVQWAVAKNTALPPLDGIYIDGENVWATDGYRAAKYPCVFPLGDSPPITVPATIVIPIIRNLGDTRVGVRGNFLVLMPDDYTQIKVIIYDAPFRNVSIFSKMEHSEVVMVKRADVAGMVGGMAATVKDKTKLVEMTIGNGEVTFELEDQLGAQVFENGLDLPVGGDHSVHTIKFSADPFVQALSSCPNESIALFYEPGSPKKPIHIDGGSGYHVWAAPIMPTGGGSDG